MVMAEGHYVAPQSQQLSSYSKEKLLLLDRNALRAAVTARYRSSRENLTSDNDEDSRRTLEGDDEGRFAIASSGVRPPQGVQSTGCGSTAKATRPKQRRIKSAAPRVASASHLTRKHSSSRDGSQFSLTSGSSTLLSDSSASLASHAFHHAPAYPMTTSVSGLETARGATRRRSKQDLATTSMQWSSTQPTSRHLAKAERPHSSYTRPSSAACRAKIAQLSRRRSVSEPSQLHINVDDTSMLSRPRAAQTAGAQLPGQGTSQPTGTQHGGAPRRQRPHSAMPRLQQQQQQQKPQSRPSSAQFKPVYRFANSPNEAANTELSITGQQIPLPQTHVWPGLIEEIDEEELALREREDEEFELLMLSDPVAAREQALRKALQIKKLETLKRPLPPDWRSGRIEIPDFHCDRCRDYWLRHGYVPDDCDKKRRSISQFNLSRPSPSKSRKVSRKNSDGDALVAPVNSVANLGDTGGAKDDNDGAGGTFHPTLSTIAGSQGDMLKSEAGSTATLRSSHGDTQSQTGRGGSHGSGAGMIRTDQGVDPRAFIGADGKIYTPDDALGRYKPEGIPGFDATDGSAGGGSGKQGKRSKRAKSARATANGKTTDDQMEGSDGDSCDDGDGGSMLGLHGDSSEEVFEDSATHDAQTTHSKRMINGVRVNLDPTPPAATAKPTPARARPKKAKEPLKLENLQDLFTRAFTFTYYVPSKASKGSLEPGKAPSKTNKSRTKSAKKQ